MMLVSEKWHHTTLNLDLQEKRIAQEIADLEKDTGYKLRVLAQNYPDTPGMST